MSASAREKHDHKHRQTRYTPAEITLFAGTDDEGRGVTFEEYRGRVGNVAFVEPDMAHFVPVGVPDLFLEIYASADYVEAVNTLALPRYMKRELMPFDKGMQLEAQMNVLPICSVPREAAIAARDPAPGRAP